MSSTIRPSGDFAARSRMTRSNTFAASGSSWNSIPLRSHSYRRIFRQRELRSSTVSVWDDPMSMWRTGHFFDQSHFGSMARPSNKARRPSKSERRVETASDFPKRRGRAMKNCEPLSPDAIA